MAIFREFILAIIFVIFIQKWQFRLENENFEISRNSANLKWITIQIGTLLLYTAVHRVILFLASLTFVQFNIWITTYLMKCLKE